ncbi:hypothetical protein THAOC_19455 [Thalassiosira oceanica]|uniref:Uncharacterized protein n=1 Tax=Thalassiosira oceanica TaxID=159749 RepID=K0S5T1_THAOC|nr:hypothetical protein THAOC_19455 [Thalassiosira oceanica]|eukprot:EJK60234.1 hypothetical protein THAOC_19455 [Thalassiosira oceanica]
MERNNGTKVNCSMESPAWLTQEDEDRTAHQCQTPFASVLGIGRHGGQGAPSSSRRANDLVDSISSTADGIIREISGDQPPKFHQQAIAFFSGTASFYATSFASQLMQHKVLGISTGTRPSVIPTAIGIATVAAGSWMGHLAGVGVTSAFGTIKDKYLRGSLAESILDQLPQMRLAAAQSIHEMARPLKLIMRDDLSRGERRERNQAWMHAARVCVLGLLTYKMVLRSNFFSISTSSYTHKGSFARVGIPATMNYASPSQRIQIEKLGRRWGCHTCGSRMIFSKLSTKFHGDHIPPVSVAKQMSQQTWRKFLGLTVPQKFYPQCVNCSGKQGSLLSKAVNEGMRNLSRAGGGKDGYFHSNFRIGHLTGGAVAILTTSISAQGTQTPEAVVSSSRLRVKSYQDWAQERLRKIRSIFRI